MHPAFSVIFFTTLSGAGYGLLAWTALAAMLRWAGAQSLLACVVLALVLVTVGLLSSTAHLGKPQRAWRAFSQWRTSWLSREGVLALATYVPALALAALAAVTVFAAHGDDSLPRGWSGAIIATGVLLLLGALATVACTAMIYASLKPIPAWRHPAVVPVYLLFALLTGGLLCGALLARDGIGNGVAIAGIAAAIVLAVLKSRYWRDIDTTPLTVTRADAVGLPGRDVSVFERPHTEANYLTREMGFVVARKHARRLRQVALALFAILPALLLVPVWLFVHVDAAPWLLAAALSALIGALVERWLFFAQARHLVTLYY
ncbi:dimethyl sulfoxide reductase anchor subunit family protein [Lysobacter solisilvae (ex Woo and Kim 2022)]|uniref:Dimethyl sulfoxide reductase anchor subunit n=1 Tax=Agrilutibacter terrestris TaxID=2865112 RepID=A0A7H0FUE4_9GAMM|nr:DmsC/YnfH family molybdoenzyme membrane anchor subunit [Lysobacter terrestris]QNP39660.1 dimethyl sulfoxide reductase anchor subunit [Lysobacter terrestris]